MLVTLDLPYPIPPDGLAFRAQARVLWTPRYPRMTATKTLVFSYLDYFTHYYLSSNPTHASWLGLPFMLRPNQSSLSDWLR